MQRRLIKSIELIHPPHYNSTDDRLDPPLGLLSIAAYLKHFCPDVEVRVNDLSGIETSEPISIGKADIYGITVYAPSMETTRNIIKKCRSKNPKAAVIVGGVHVSALPNLFRGLADHVVVGYGEQAMVDLLKSRKRLPFIIRNDRLEEYFLVPLFELVEIDTYRRVIGDKKSLPLLTTRGCPFKCNFCGLSYMHDIFGVRFAKPEIVVEQVEHLKNAFGIKAINFQDDIFTLNRDRLFKLLDLIAPLDISFRCHGRAGCDVEETYERLAAAGCKQVAWGIESGSQKILDRMNKQVKVEDNLNVIRWAKKYGIITRAFFIVGFPGETEETLNETKRFIEQARPDQYFVSNFVPYPGTQVWHNPSAFGVTNMVDDFNQYYQVNKEGYGGITIDTEWLTREEFRRLEYEFREWIAKNNPLRGFLQDYEKEILQR